MRLVSKTVCERQRQHLDAHIFTALQCRHSVHAPPITTGAILPAWQESQHSDPVIPSTQPTLQRLAASRRCNNTPHLGLVAYALRATSVYTKLPPSSTVSEAPSGFAACAWVFACLFFCLPHLNPLLAPLTCSFPLFFLDRKSALETEFTCSQYPTVETEDEVLIWNIVVRNSEAVECSVSAAYVSKEMNAVGLLSVKAVVLWGRDKTSFHTPPLSHASTKRSIIIR